MRRAYQIVSDHYAASARGDLAGMMAEVAPDVQWTEMAGFPCAGTHVGPAQVIEKVFEVLGREWEGFHRHAAGGAGHALRVAARQAPSASVGRIDAVDDALQRVERVLPGAVPGVEVQRVAHTALQHRIDAIGTTDQHLLAGRQ